MDAYFNFLLSLCLFLNTMPGLICTNHCDYLMGTQIISCENSIGTIQEVTDLMDANTNVVMIRGGRKLRITRSCHKNNNCKHITSYQISKIDDLEIDPYGFEGLTNLLYLKITDNGLYRLENHAFRGLEELQRLDVTNCSLNSVSDTAFAGLSKLEGLDLANNNIKSITSKIFKDLANLNSLCLYNNEIESLYMNSFSSLINLRDLDLTNNKIKRIDTKIFNKIPKLSYLYLSYNQIEVIVGNFECQSLKFLYLRRNNLKEINEQLLKSSPNLVDLDLSFNSIAKIDSRAFYMLDSLMNLNLRNNTAVEVEKLLFSGQGPLVTV